MAQAEITVKYLGQNKKNAKFGFIVSSEEDTYGCLSEQLKEFSTGQIYTIQYHTNPKGYKEFDAIVGKPPVKQNIRPATNPQDSDRMATMGMVNAILNGMCERLEPSAVLSLGADTIAQVIQMCHDGLMRSVIKGKQVQTRDDLNDQIQF